MILQHQTPQSPLNKVLCFVAAFFSTGIALMLLNEFYQALTTYQALILRILAFSAVVLILSFVAYVSVSLFLTIEYRATENLIFKESRQQLQIADKSLEDEETDYTESRILELYDDMTFHNSLSMNQIALDVYGKKGGFYNNLIKEVLAKNGREI